MDPRSPDMSVIVITPDAFHTVRNTIRCLRAQTVREQLEVILVAPSSAQLDIDASEMEGFCQFRVVEVGPFQSTARARAAGILQASAPIVALTEDHVFPASDWAEMLIGAHRGPWAAVGPAMRNANPHSLISWATFLIEYAPWHDPSPGGMMDHLPGHNGTYKRSVLLEYGTKLGDMLEAESVLHWNLRSKGHQLYLERKAIVAHQNFSAMVGSIRLRFHSGRLFAAARARDWPLVQRWLFALGAPLIPLVRLWRIIRELRQAGRRRDLLPRLLPALIFFLAIDGMGEMVGYLLDQGNAMQKLSDMEFHRHRYLRETPKEVTTT